MIEEEGELSAEAMNDANIPVNIFISQEHDGKWKLSADNFMPRKNRASEGAYSLTADSREEFNDFLNRTRQLYAVALEILDDMIKGTAKCLYYWEKKEDKEDQ